MIILNGDREDDDGTAGNVAAAHAHYARTKNCVIEHNIFAGKNATNNAIVYLGYDTSHTFYPTGNTFTLLDLSERGLESIVRASVHYYNSEEEVERFIQTIEMLL